MLVLESYSFSKIESISDSINQNNRATECLSVLNSLEFEENFDAATHHFAFSMESGLKRNHLFEMEGSCADVYKSAFDPIFTAHSGRRELSDVSYGAPLPYLNLCYVSNVTLNLERWCKIYNFSSDTCISTLLTSSQPSILSCQLQFETLPGYDTIQEYNLFFVNKTQVQITGSTSKCKNKCMSMPTCGGFVKLGAECYFKSLDAKYEKNLTPNALAYRLEKKK